MFLLCRLVNLEYFIWPCLKAIGKEKDTNVTLFATSSWIKSLGKYFHMQIHMLTCIQAHFQLPYFWLTQLTQN